MWRKQRQITLMLSKIKRNASNLLGLSRCFEQHSESWLIFLLSSDDLVHHIIALLRPVFDYIGNWLSCQEGIIWILIFPLSLAISGHHLQLAFNKLDAFVKVCDGILICKIRLVTTSIKGLSRIVATFWDRWWVRWNGNSFCMD